MAKLKPCKACKHMVSVWASKCPSCGQGNPTVTAKDYLAMIALIGIVIFFFSISSGDETGTAAAPSLPKIDFQGVNVINDDGMLACSSKEAYDEMFGYIQTKDEDAYTEGLMKYAMAGICRIFNKGEEVYIQDSSALQGLLKVRMKGKTTSYWIIREAVEKKPIAPETP